MTVPCIRVFSSFRTKTAPKSSAALTITARRGLCLMLLFGTILSPKIFGEVNEPEGEPAHAQWRENMVHKATPGEGCFQASFPAVRWEPVQCKAVTGPTHPTPRVTTLIGPGTVGNGNDYAIVAPGTNLITQTVGSFPSVRGVTSEIGAGGANDYSLQLNTNFFSTTSACTGGAAGCRVWQQFLYVPGTVFIQYWLINYRASGAACPAGYNTSGTSCFKNSAGTPAPVVPATGLQNVTLTGTAASGGNDTAVFTNSGTAYSVTALDSVLKIATVWNQSEFNVVGDGNGSQANFNAGTVITVNSAAQYGSTTAPTCVSGAGTTAETNNLNLLPCTATGGATPNIQFIESLLTVPTISKAFNPTSIPAGGVSTVTLTLTNPNTGISLTGASFSDTLVGMSAAGGAVGGTCVGTTPNTLSPGATSLSFSHITIPAGASCTVTFTVTSVLPGVTVNTTNGVSSNEALTGSPSNTPTLTVIAPPSITKTFVPNKILPGGTTTVSFSITNPNNFVALTGVAFTDTLPAGLVVASPVAGVSTCGGTATASAGSGTISLSGGSIASSGSCTVTVNVTAPEGIYPNSVQVTSTNGGVGNTSSATLFVATPPNLTKAFGKVSIGTLSSTTLGFTLMNPNHVVTLDALQFSDTLPVGLVIATPNGLTGSCGGGTILAPAGSTLITVGSAVLAAQASCTFSVNVTATGAAIGLLTNTTSTVTSTEALPGAAASATIFIGDPFQVSYAANLNIGESYVDITNTGANGAPLLGPGFGGASGNICANVYAFDSGEELVACCSCLITPDQTVNLGVNRDLTVKTLTGVIPTSVTIKVLATLAGPGGTGTSCTNTAATVGTATLANGVAAWGTTLHATPTAAFATTERRFLGAALSTGELASIGGRCAFILGNGSTFGVCNSCKAGALGAGANQQ
jgi:hypothetical protein